MQTVEMAPMDITKKVVAIVKFGPATPMDGLTPAQFYQVTIDPSKVSPSGEYIRFGNNPGDEILGWQKVKAMTILEVLAEWDGDEPPNITIGANGVTILAVE